MHLEISPEDVKAEIRDSVLRYGEKRMAGDLDMGVSTLSNKIQPYGGPDRRHHLSLDEYDQILTRTNNYDSLESLAYRHGFLLLPLDAQPDGDTVEIEKLQDVQALAAYQAEEDPIKRVHKLHVAIRDLLETEVKIREQNKEGSLSAVIRQVREGMRSGKA